MGKIYHANFNQRKTRVATLIPGKVDFGAKRISGDRGTLCNTKGPIRKDDTAVPGLHVPNSRPAKYVKQKPIELKEETPKPTIIVEDFKTHLSTIDRQTRQKTSKALPEFNTTAKAQDLIDVYRTPRPTTAEYTFFSCTYGTNTKISHIWAIKRTDKFQSTEIMQGMLTDHDGIKTEMSNRVWRAGTDRKGTPGVPVGPVVICFLI